MIQDSCIAEKKKSYYNHQLPWRCPGMWVGKVRQRPSWSTEYRECRWTPSMQQVFPWCASSCSRDSSHPSAHSVWSPESQHNPYSQSPIWHGFSPSGFLHIQLSPREAIFLTNSKNNCSSVLGFLISVIPPSYLLCGLGVHLHSPTVSMPYMYAALHFSRVIWSLSNDKDLKEPIRYLAQCQA